MFKNYAFSRTVVAVFFLTPIDAFACVGPKVAFSDLLTPPKQILRVAQRHSTIGDLDVLARNLGPPPEHGSAGHCAELESLRQIQATAENVDRLICEQDFACFRLGGIELSDLRSGKFPRVSLLIVSSLWHLDGKLFALKLRYDRARPSFVSRDVVPLIPVPKHPSYPSGHAAQARLIAELLSHLEPCNRSAFVADALRIARNRERAGLHYQSDTAAGIVLAREMFVALAQERWFRDLLNKAIGEWQSTHVGRQGCAR